MFIDTIHHKKVRTLNDSFESSINIKRKKEVVILRRLEFNCNKFNPSTNILAKAKNIAK